MKTWLFVCFGIFLLARTAAFSSCNDDCIIGDSVCNPRIYYEIDGKLRDQIAKCKQIISSPNTIVEELCGIAVDAGIDKIFPCEFDESHVIYKKCDNILKGFCSFDVLPYEKICAISRNSLKMGCDLSKELIKFAICDKGIETISEKDDPVVNFCEPWFPSSISRCTTKFVVCRAECLSEEFLKKKLKCSLNSTKCIRQCMEPSEKAFKPMEEIIESCVKCNFSESTAEECSQCPWKLLNETARVCESGIVKKIFGEVMKDCLRQCFTGEQCNGTDSILTRVDVQTENLKNEQKTIQEYLDAKGKICPN